MFELFLFCKVNWCLVLSGALQDALQGEVVPRLRHWLTQGNDAWNEDS